MNKLIAIAAPSGCGKTTIVKKLLNTKLNLKLSISYTTRNKRKNEVNNIDYNFITIDEFKNKINNNEFLEFEEVYKNNFYGTSKIDIENILKTNNVIFDIDVFGAKKLKNIFNENILTIFILPPTIDELKTRLIVRNTDSLEQIENRVNKAKLEIENSKDFDFIIENDILDNCYEKIFLKIKKFLYE